MIGQGTVSPVALVIGDLAMWYCARPTGHGGILFLALVAATVGACDRSDSSKDASSDGTLQPGAGQPTTTDERSQVANDRRRPMPVPKAEPVLGFHGILRRPVSAIAVWEDGTVLFQRRGSQWHWGAVDSDGVSTCLTKLRAIGFFDSKRYGFVIPDAWTGDVWARDGTVVQVLSSSHEGNWPRTQISKDGSFITDLESSPRHYSDEFKEFFSIWVSAIDSIGGLVPSEHQPYTGDPYLLHEIKTVRRRNLDG